MSRTQCQTFGTDGICYGLPSRVDMLKTVGNAQVPEVVARVWEVLSA